MHWNKHRKPRLYINPRREPLDNHTDCTNMETNCPECGVEINTTNFRWVKESCGHGKCRRCLLTAENGCLQCQQHEEVEGNTKYEEDLVEVQEEATADTETVFIVTDDKGKLKEDPEIIPETHDSDVIYEQIGEVFEEDEFYESEENQEEQKQGVAMVDLERELLTMEARSSRGSRKSSGQPKKQFSEDNLPLHITRVDSGSTWGKAQFSCDLCQKVITKNLVGYHIYCDPAIPKPYGCRLCDKTFRTPDHLKYHNETHTQSQVKLDCPQCPKQFRNKITLRAHIRQNHRGLEAPHVCADCGKGFFSLAKYEEHLRIHTNELPFECDQCGKRFRLKENMLKHQRLTHSDVKNFYCELCDTYFKRSGAHKAHMERTHPEGDKAPITCVCNVCGKGFAHKSFLKRHERSHESRIQFSCAMCTATFSRKDNMFRHVRIMHFDGDLQRTPQEDIHFTVAEVVERPPNYTEPTGKYQEYVDDNEIIEEVVGENEEVQEGAAEGDDPLEEQGDEDQDQETRKNSVIIFVGDRKRPKREREVEVEFANMPSDKMEIYRKILMPNRGGGTYADDDVEEVDQDGRVVEQYVSASSKQRKRTKRDM